MKTVTGAVCCVCKIREPFVGRSACDKCVPPTENELMLREDFKRERKRNFAEAHRRRDYFAAKAMQGLISACGREIDQDQLASLSYQQADAMIAASLKRNAQSPTPSDCPDCNQPVQQCECEEDNGSTTPGRQADDQPHIVEVWV